MASQIEDELLAATQLKKAKMVNQGYLKRIVEGVERLEDDDWEKLSRPAQDWVNAGVVARDDKTVIADFPDREDDETEAEEEEAEAEEEEEEAEVEAIKPTKEPIVSKNKKAVPKKAAPPVKKLKAVKKSAKKAAPAKSVMKSAKRPTKDAGGLKLQIKELMLSNFDMSADDLAVKLAKSGTKPSKFTIAAVRSEFRQTLRLLKNKGMLKGAPI